MEADKDRDGKISFEEFTKMVENTDVSMSMTLGKKRMTNKKKKKPFPGSCPSRVPVKPMRPINYNCWKHPTC